MKEKVFGRRSFQRGVTWRRIEKRCLFQAVPLTIAVMVLMLCRAPAVPSESTFVTVTVQDQSYIVKHHGEDKDLFKSDKPRQAMEWALNHSRIAVLTGGEFNVEGTFNIPRPGVTLIIASDATVQPAENSELIIVSEGAGNYRPLIHNKGMDNVAVINFGTLRGGACIMFNGRSGGELGIDGGLVFSAGKMEQSGDAIWLIDSQNLQVPFAADKSYGNNLMAIEGCEDLEIGTVAGLAGKNQKENETIDLNSYSRRIHIRRMIGASRSEQILDVNNSTDITVDNITGYTDSDTFKESLVDIINYPPNGGRRLTQRPRIEESENIEVRSKGVADEKISDWEITADVDDMMKSLPELRVTVRITGNPKKNKVTVFEGTYQFELGEIQTVTVVE